MPRLAAFSLGLLMFTTNTLVSEGRVEGKALLNNFGSQGWDLCRATDMQVDHASTMWFSRILRRPPSVHEKGSSFTCFNVHTHGLLWWSADELKGTFVDGLLKASPQPFNKSRLQAYFDDHNSIAATLDHRVEMPYNGSAPLSHSFGFPMIDVVPVLEDVSDGDLTDADFSQHGFHCMYQCTKFKSVGLMSVIEKVGTIVAGSAVVVKTTDTISTNFGGHIWGLPLVHKGTAATTIKTIIKATRSQPGKGRSKFWACGVCCFAMTPLRFASKLNVDGYFTVDYYVTAVFFSSLIMACVVRQFQPYKMMRIAYTEKMWTDGKDSFLDQKSHTFKEINLYEWIHLSQLARADHLKNYAQGMSPEGIKEELVKQKQSREEVAEKKKAKETEKKAVEEAAEKRAAEKMTAEEKAAEEEAAEKKTAEQKAAEKKTAEEEHKKSQEAKRKEAKRLEGMILDEHQKEMKKKYYNAHANLVVRVIRQITISTVSPPHQGDNDLNIQKGSVVSKVVVVRPDAVGTIVEQVNADVVKIRIPKKVHKNAPVLVNRLPRVSLEKEGGKEGTKEYSSSEGEGEDEMDTNKPKKQKTPKRPICFEGGLPITLIDPNTDPKHTRFDPNDEEVFATVKDKKLRQKFADGTKKIERQYHMTLTPYFSDNESKHKVNTWLHNSVLRMLKPRPREVKEDDDEDHETKPGDEATKWEDIEVPLGAIIEASKAWVDMEVEREKWMRDMKVAAAAAKDNKVEKSNV